MPTEYIERVMRDGRLNKNAMRIRSPLGFDFKSYSYGVGHFVRVCPELNAVLEQPNAHRNFYNGKVGDVSVAPGPRGFTSLAKTLAAIEFEALRQGIIDADGKIMESTDAPQA